MSACLQADKNNLREGKHILKEKEHSWWGYVLKQGAGCVPFSEPPMILLQQERLASRYRHRCS